MHEMRGNILGPVRVSAPTLSHPTRFPFGVKLKNIMPLFDHYEPVKPHHRGVWNLFFRKGSCFGLKTVPHKGNFYALPKRGSCLSSGFGVTAGVFSGSALFYVLLSFAASRFRRRLPPSGALWLNRISGAIIIGFGVVSLVVA